MGYFVELAYSIGDCIENVRFSVILTGIIILLVLKQIFLDTVMCIVRYNCNAMRDD